MTRARLAANRRSALLSTGPRTKAGKARSRLNGLRNGNRSGSYDRLFEALVQAHPGAVHETVASVLTPEQFGHPFFASFVERFQKIQEFAFEQSAAYRRAKAEFRRKRRERQRKKIKGRPKPECYLESEQS
jgi:hypothetical protein